MLVSIRPPGGSPFRMSVAPDGTWTLPDDSRDSGFGDDWWALPGLVDAHAHLAADKLDLAPGDPAAIRRRAYACLEKGVFLVVDKGWGDDSVVTTLSDTPPAEGPDLEAAARMIAAEGGYYPGFAVETDRKGLEAEVRSAVQRGRGWVKLVGDWPRKGRGLVPNFDEEALRAAVEVAHAGGARVAIHTTGPDVASWAVWAGVDSIEHGLFLTAAELEELGRRQGAWVPTILRMEATAEALGSASSGSRLITAALADLPELLADLPDGVRLLAGTDLATPPGGVAAEVLALHRRGLSARAAVDAASGEARSYVGHGPGFEPGRPADAVFFGRDPYEDPSTLTQPMAVLRSGRRVR